MNNWRYDRPFDITKKGLISHNFDGQNTFVYDNVNLSIFVTDYCNATCDFCVAQLRYLNDGSEYIKPKIQNDDEYIERLDNVLSQIRVLNPSVSLTGGEPTHGERLVRVIELLKKHDIRKRTITSNGSGLFKQVNNKTILQHLIDNDFKHLNISKSHYNDDLNRKIMKYRENEFNNEMLKEVINQTKSTQLRPRISCVLIKDSIHTLEGMKDYMNHMQEIGIDNMVFRELMRYDEGLINTGRIPEFCTRNHVPLVPIWEQIDNDKDFSFINPVLGYYYYVEVYRYGKIDMVSETADLKKIYTERAKAKELLGKPVVFEMVFHPNGYLNGSWREWEEILLKY